MEFRTEENTRDIQQLDGKTILDFGCGEGGFAVALADRLRGTKIIGIDLLEGQYAAKKLIAEKQLDNVEFVIDKSEHLEDATFDVVFSHDSCIIYAL